MKLYKYVEFLMRKSKKIAKNFPFLQKGLNLKDKSKS